MLEHPAFCPGAVGSGPISVSPTGNMEAGPSFCALIENGEDSYTEAYLHDHDVEELQASYVPAAPGQRVLDVNYQCDGDSDGAEIWYGEIPVISWRLVRGDVEPIGPKGKIADGSNCLWRMLCSDGKVVWPMMGTYDSLKDALEQVKDHAKAEAGRRARRV